MARTSSKYVVKFDHPIMVELHPDKKIAECFVYFSSNGQITGSEVILKHPYAGKKYTLCTLEDELTMLAKAKDLYNGTKQVVEKDLDTNEGDEEATRHIRKKDLISSNSFSRIRTEKPSISKPQITLEKPSINNKEDSLYKVRSLILENNNNITVKDICQKLNLSDSAIQTACKKLNVIRTKDENYKGKGRRFLLSIKITEDEYLPHKDMKEQKA